MSLFFKKYPNGVWVTDELYNDRDIMMKTAFSDVALIVHPVEEYGFGREWHVSKTDVNRLSGVNLVTLATRPTKLGALRLANKAIAHATNKSST